MKIIFDKPICNTDACCNHDPNYPNNCAIWTNVDGCYLAEIKRPNCIQRTLAWVDRHWLRIAAILAIIAIFMILGFISYSEITNKVIDDMRQMDIITMAEMQKGNGK